jgi:transposase-like protein
VDFQAWRQRDLGAKRYVYWWAEGIYFYHFPAEHWSHLRTTNPIESTFATVCLRTRADQRM